MSAFAIGEARPRIDVRAMLLLAILAAVWGFQQTTVKIAIGHGMPPALQVTLRSVFATALLVGWVGARQGRGAVRHLFAVDASLVPGLWSGVLFGAEFLLAFGGLKYTTASRGALFMFTMPFFTAVGAHFFVPVERLRLRQVVGLMCAFVGVALAVSEGVRGGAGGTLVGDAMVLGCAAMWGALTVLVKASRTLRAAGTAKTLLYQLGGSIPLLLAAMFVLGDWGGVATAEALAWWCLLYQVVVVAFVSYLVWYWLIAMYPAGRLAAFSFLTPIFGVAFGHFVLAEPATIGLLGALGCVAFGLWLVNTAREG